MLSHVPHQMKTVCSMKSVFKELADPCVTAMRIVTMDTFARRDSVLLDVLQIHSVERMKLVSTLSARTHASLQNVDNVLSVQFPIMKLSVPVLPQLLAIL